MLNTTVSSAYVVERLQHLRDFSLSNIKKDFESARYQEVIARLAVTDAKSALASKSLSKAYRTKIESFDLLTLERKSILLSGEIAWIQVQKTRSDSYPHEVKTLFDLASQHPEIFKDLLISQRQIFDALQERARYYFKAHPNEPRDVVHDYLLKQ